MVANRQRFDWNTGVCQHGALRRLCEPCAASDILRAEAEREERACQILSILGAGAFALVAIVALVAVVRSGLFSWIGR